MRFARTLCIACALGLAAGTAAAPSQAAIIVANCTGMVNFDIYNLDDDQPVQEVEGVGKAEYERNDDFILLRGAFGEMKFDLKAGTLYRNGSDTGIYCTYTGIPQ